jgi:hypothetical protein
VGSRTARASLAAAAAAILAMYPAIANGDTQRAQVTAPQIFRIASISPWTDKDHPFKLKVQITNPTELALESVSVRVSVFGRVLSRSQLRSALDGGTPTESIGSLVERLDEPVAPGEQRTVTVERPVADLLGSIAGRGVYPIQVSVEHSRGTAVAYTAIPFFPPGSNVEPLNITWILPVTAPTIRPTGGVYTQAAIDSLDMAQLMQQMKAVAARPGANVTLAPDPILLDTLADLADGFRLAGPSGAVTVRPEDTIARAAAGLLDQMRASAAAAGEIATVPYAPADLTALARRRLQGDALRQITLGRSVAAQLLGRPTDLSVLVPPGRAIDAASASALSPLGLSGLVIDQSLLQPLTEPFQPQLFGPSRPIAFTGSSLKALLPDALLTQRMNGTEQGVLLAQAVIAETASSWLELPSLASERLIVIDSPPGLAPTVLASMLNGLRGAPWARMETATQAFDTLPPEGAQLRLPILQRDRPFLDAARRARAALTTLTAITVTPPADVDVLDRSILAAESDEWSTAPGAGISIADGVRDTVQGMLGRISVGAGRRVTLTSHTGSVPVTVINNNPFPVRVRVRVTSPKVVFPQGGSQITVVPPPNDTLDFKIQARTAGSYPLDVSVETPDGNRLIARGSVILRSSAVSAVTLLIVAGSTVFLLLAWLRRAHKRDRGRIGHEAAAPPADSA